MRVFHVKRRPERYEDSGMSWNCECLRLKDIQVRLSRDLLCPENRSQLIIKNHISVRFAFNLPDRCKYCKTVSLNYHWYFISAYAQH